MIVAQIAYDLIAAEDPRARKEIDRLLAIPVEPLSVTARSVDFVSASHWADDVKRLEGFTQTANEHFIDYPFSDDGTVLPADLPQPDNIVVALEKYVSILKEARSSDQDRAQALRFVIHFVGDIHQPLHCASRVSAALPEGDRGGNDLMIRHTVGNAHPQIKLHGYWDSGLDSFPKEGGHFAPPPLELIAPAAAAIRSAYKLDLAWKQGGSTNFAGWAKESEQIATAFVYHGIVALQVPGDDYIAEGVRTAEYRVLTAGYRLAALLEDIWPNT